MEFFPGKSIRDILDEEWGPDLVRALERKAEKQGKTLIEFLRTASIEELEEVAEQVFAVA